MLNTSFHTPQITSTSQALLSAYKEVYQGR